jgi:hypothetical protein
MMFVALDRIEEFARFLAAHLARQVLIIRGPPILIRALIRIAARGSGGRLTGLLRRLIAF